MSRLAEILESATPEDAARRARDWPDGERKALVEELASEVLRQLRIDANRALVVADLTTAVAGETNGNGEARARAAWVRGHALAGLVRAAEALAEYDRAAEAYERLGREDEVARIALGRVNALTWLGRYREAIAVGERARGALLDAGRDLAAAGLDVNLGNLFHRLADPQAALTHYDRALDVANQHGATDTVSTVQLNRATALSALGRIDAAAHLYQKVRDEADDAGKTRVRAFADFNLGYIRFQCGEYGRAWDTLDAARQSFEELRDDHFLALTLVDLAELLIETASWRRAATTSERARDLAASLGLRLEQARAVLMRAIAAVGAGDFDQAAQSLDEADDLFAEEGNAGLRALVDVYRARLLLRRGEPGPAAERAVDAAEVSRLANLRVQEIGARLVAAEALLAGRDLDEARRQLRLAGARLRGVPSPWLRARREHLRGRLEEAHGRRGEAVRAYRNAVAKLEDIRGRIGVDEFRVGFGDANADVYADLIELVLQGRSRAAVTDAFALIERARSRSLVDLLAGRLNAHDEADPRVRSLLDRLATLRGELNRASGFASDRGDGLRRPAVAAASSVGALEEEIADTLRRLERRNARLGALTQGETATVDDTKRSLPADTELVEYFVGPRGSWAIVVDREGSRSVQLPVGRDDLRGAVSRLRFQIEKRAIGDEYARPRERLLLEGVSRHLDSLAEKIWAPLELRARRIVVVPHGSLHFVPFAALPIGNGESVVDRHVVSALPSASCRRFVARGPRHRDDPRVLAVASHAGDLPGADREVARVRKAFARGRMLRGPRATWSAFRDEAARADVIHVATHGLFRHDDPGLSALLLADGWVRVADLLSLRLDADLVSLSACQSGRVEVSGGDEMVGLCRGFLHAGARSLLVSLWPVDDRVTEALMGAFYRNLRAQGDPAEALAAAMRLTRAEWPHPFHWAPFFTVSWPRRRPAGAPAGRSKA